MAVEVMTVEVAEATAKGFAAIGAGLAVGLTGMGTGLAQFGIGATAENKDLFGLALLFTVIPETIVIFGLVVALLLLF